MSKGELILVGTTDDDGQRWITEEHHAEVIEQKMLEGYGKGRDKEKNKKIILKSIGVALVLGIVSVWVAWLTGVESPRELLGIGFAATSCGAFIGAKI